MINTYKFDNVEEIKLIQTLFSYYILDTPPQEEFDSLKVLRHLKSHDRTKGFPVVMITSSKEEKDTVKSHRLGVNSYIVKPVEFENFSKSVSGLGYTCYWSIKSPENKKINSQSIPTLLVY